jgi:hypothetical protein
MEAVVPTVRKYCSCIKLHIYAILSRIPSSWIWRHVARVGTDVSEERIASLMNEEICSSGTSVLTRATWRHIPEDDALHSHHRDNLKSCMQYIPFQYLKL